MFKSTNKTSPNQTPPRPYSPAILAQIPVKQLLLYAGQNHAHYSALYPSLLRLTATHLPQLCLVEDWLKGEEHSDRGEPAYTSCNTVRVKNKVILLSCNWHTTKIPIQVSRSGKQMLSSVLQVTQTCSWHNGQQLYRYVLVLCTALTPCANMYNTSAVQMMVQMSHNCYQVTRYITEHLYAMAKSTKTIVVNWTSTFFEQQLRYPLNDPYCILTMLILGYIYAPYTRWVLPLRLASCVDGRPCVVFMSTQHGWLHIHTYSFSSQ